MPKRKEPSDKALLEKYAPQVEAFRVFCTGPGRDERTFDEINFRDLSIGFFIALGVSGDSGSGEPFYDAFVLASLCRYRLQYWQT